jgi:ABC-type phosphate transport system permease subunit
MNKDLPGIKNTEVKNKSALGRSIGEKQFRFSDWFAGKLIKTVSFFSIAFVILIFLFVFRETLPMFSSRNNPGRQYKGTETGEL